MAMAMGAEAKSKSVDTHGGHRTTAPKKISNGTGDRVGFGHQAMLGLRGEMPSPLPTAVGLCACGIVGKGGLFQRKREGHCIEVKFHSENPWRYFTVTLQAYLFCIGPTAHAKRCF